MKHFNIWPSTLDKNNLFEEQKQFIIYLMGVIPSQDDWAIQTDYKIKLQAIKDLKSIKINKTDFDLAEMQGQNIEKLKKERLAQYKKRLISELNENFGISEKRVEIDSDISTNTRKHDRQDKLWELLQGKINKEKPEDDK